MQHAPTSPAVFFTCTYTTRIASAPIKAPFIGPWKNAPCAHWHVTKDRYKLLIVRQKTSGNPRFQFTFHALAWCIQAPHPQANCTLPQSSPETGRHLDAFLGSVEHFLSRMQSIV